MIAFRSFAGWRIADLGPDLAAGLTLAAIAIPEQMATARLGGFSPVTGFIVFIAGSLAFAALGSSRVLSAGADSTITPIFAGAIAASVAAGSPGYFSLAILLAIMTGIVVMAAGIFRLGWIANLLSIPVMTGFLAGIAVHIAVSQLPTLLGLPVAQGSLLPNLAAILEELGATNFDSLALGAGVFAIIYAAEKIDTRIPGALIALVAATLITIGLDLERHGVGTIGTVAGGWPGFAIAMPNVADVERLVPLSLIIAVVVMVQTAATARAFSIDNGQPDVSRDFMGVGAGGILSGFAGGFAVNASPPRTGAVTETGGRSQLTGLTAAAIIAALLLFGTGLLAHIPTAALAGVLFFVAQRIVRVSVFATLWRQSSREFLLVVATTAAIVVLPIQTGVGLGIALSVLHGLWTIGLTQPIEFEHLPGTTIWWPPNPKLVGEKFPQVMVLAFQAPLAFFNADIFERGTMRLIESRAPIELFVLEASSIVHIDFTAAQVLKRIYSYCRDHHIRFAVARLESERAQAAFGRFGLRDLIGDDHIFHSVHDAVVTLAPTSQAR
jgi:sulfate permease, SulP family